MVIGFLNIGTSEMLLIVFVALLLFGGKKLPELARGLGRGIREFKDASESIKRDISEQINNFEKDVEVKDLIVDDVEQEIDSALPPANKTNEQPKQQVLAASPHFSAPDGTYQHNPGREPDYYGSEGTYYHDPAPGPSESSSINGNDQTAGTLPKEEDKPE